MNTNSVYSVLGKYRMFRCPYCSEVHTYIVDECISEKVNKTLYLKIEAACCGKLIVARKDSEGQVKKGIKDYEFSG